MDKHEVRWAVEELLHAYILDTCRIDALLITPL